MAESTDALAGLLNLATGVPGPLATADFAAELTLLTVVGLGPMPSVLWRDPAPWRRRKHGRATPRSPRGEATPRPDRPHVPG